MIRDFFIVGGGVMSCRIGIILCRNGYKLKIYDNDPEAIRGWKERFDAIAKGYEEEPEGGARCPRCFRLRLEETARAAKEGGYDWFCTTLSVSPHKNAHLLNEIGQEMSVKYGIPYQPSDFKKREGYKRSIEFILL